MAASFALQGCSASISQLIHREKALHGSASEKAALAEQESRRLRNGVIGAVIGGVFGAAYVYKTNVYSTMGQGTAAFISAFGFAFYGFELGYLGSWLTQGVVARTDKPSVTKDHPYGSSQAEVLGTARVAEVKKDWSTAWGAYRRAKDLGPPSQFIDDKLLEIERKLGAAPAP